MFDDYKVKPFHIMFPKTSACVKPYDGQTKWMSFLIEDDDLLEKYNTIWDKVSANIKKNLIATCPLQKTKIKSYCDEVTSFYDKGFAKVDSNQTYLAVISSDSALKKDESYYLHVSLKECKYIEKR